MGYRVFLSNQSEKILKRIDRSTETRIRTRIKLLAEDPYDPRLSSPLTERAGVRKSRVGDWRILYTVDRGAEILNVAAIGPRGQIYRRP